MAWHRGHHTNNFTEVTVCCAKQMTNEAAVK